MRVILAVVRERRRTPEDYERALADISEELGRPQILAEELLMLGRNDARHRDAPEAVDLSSVLRDVAESLRPSGVSGG